MTTAPAPAPSTKPRRGHPILVVIGLCLLAIVIGGISYLSSARFQERMRLAVVARLEQSTGGRVELKSFRWNLAKLEFEAEGLTIHGLESPGQEPYFHADRLQARAQIISLLSQRVGLRLLAVEHPVVHLIVYPDGSTNQPTPRAAPSGSALAQLFDLSIRNLEVRNGTVVVNEHRWPLDISATHVELAMRFDRRMSRYEGQLAIGPVKQFELGGLSLKYRGLTPIEGTARARFTLSPNECTLQSLHWQSKDSNFDVSGELQDFAHPTAQIKYEGTVAAVTFGAVAGLPQIRSGHAQLRGEATYKSGQIASAGKLMLDNVQYHDRGVDIPHVSGSASYMLTSEEFKLGEIDWHAFGGTARGTAEFADWALAPAGTAAPRAARRPHGSANLRIEDMQLPALAAISPQAGPLARLHPAGTVSGTVNARWSGSFRNAEVVAALDAHPPMQPTPEQVPLSGTMRLTYSGAQHTVQISELDLASRGTHLTAGGAMGGAQARLNLAVNTSNLVEIQAILAALGFAPLPLRLQGRASFNGSMSGPLNAPTTAGHLHVTDFDYLLPPPSPAPVLNTAALGPSTLHFDSLDADLRHSAQDLEIKRGVLIRGKSRAEFDSHAGLLDGMLVDSSPFSIRLKLSDAELADLETLAGLTYPLAGKVSLDLTASGTRQNLRGSGHLRSSGSTIYGEPFQGLRADVRLAGKEVQLNNLWVAHNDAHVSGMVAYDPGSRAVRLDLRGSNFDLAKFHQIQTEKFTFGGIADFHLQGSGTPEAPVINADLHIRGVMLSGEQAGDFDATAVTRGPDMHLTARSHFQSAELAIDGDVRLRNDFPATIRLRFAHLDIDPVMRAYAQGHITGHSQIAGSVDLQGPLRRPRDLAIDGHLDQFSAEVETVRLGSDGPVTFKLRNQVFTLDHLHLVGDGTDVVTSGTAGLGGARELNFRVDGSLNLTLLRTFDHDLRAEGATQINALVAGTLSQPNIRGRMQIRDGTLSYVDWPNGLSNVNGTLVFNEDRLRVQSLTAQTGGGTLTLGGFIAYSHGLNFNLTMSGKDIRLRYPPGVSAYANADLSLSGTPQNSLLAGRVTVTKFGVTPQFDLGLYLARSAQPAVLPPPDSPLNKLHFDVSIVSTPELQVQTSLARISGNADLRLRGTAARPQLLGRVDIAEGDVSISSTKYHVERGEIAFKNPTRIEPVLNLDATARVRDYDITLGFHGPVDKLSLTYRSDPPLPEGDIIALLALGRTREEAVVTPAAEQTTISTTSNAILSEALNSATSSRMQKLFGISRVKIDPEAGGPENNPNARVTIEQQVSDQVTLTFISNLAQSAQQIVQVEYQVNRRISVVAVRDQNGVLSFDVKYRQRRR
jgi:translocation and assembly module TamB